MNPVLKGNLTYMLIATVTYCIIYCLMKRELKKENKKILEAELINLNWQNDKKIRDAEKIYHSNKRYIKVPDEVARNYTKWKAWKELSIGIDKFYNTLESCLNSIKNPLEKVYIYKTMSGRFIKSKSMIDNMNIYYKIIPNPKHSFFIFGGEYPQEKIDFSKELTLTERIISKRERFIADNSGRPTVILISFNIFRELEKLELINSRVFDTHYLGCHVIAINNVPDNFIKVY